MHNFGLVEEDLITFKISVLVTWTKTMRSIHCCKLITHSPAWKRTRHKLTQIVQTAGLVAILKVLIFPKGLWVVHIFFEDHFRFLQTKISGNALVLSPLPWSPPRWRLSLQHRSVLFFSKFCHSRRCSITVASLCIKHWVAFSLRASSPIWASEASLVRTRERGAEERRACNHLS